jgi:hypothetical protein
MGTLDGKTAFITGAAGGRRLREQTLGILGR